MSLKVYVVTQFDSSLHMSFTISCLLWLQSSQSYRFRD